MADITDPEVIRFVNEQVRPLCEEARALNARVDAMMVAWYAGINTRCPNDASPLKDNREGEGVSRLTGANVVNAVGNLATTAGAMNDEIISLPCVRPLAAS